jgi:hypothetical protein
MEKEGPGPLERALLVHLLDHRGHQVRFEADQWTTEFGILRAFAHEDPVVVKNTIRSLEMARWIYRRLQYVIGYSEPKLVFSLTPSGHRKALDLRREIDSGSFHSPPSPDGTYEFETLPPAPESSPDPGAPM